MSVPRPVNWRETGRTVAPFTVDDVSGGRGCPDCAGLSLGSESELTVGSQRCAAAESAVVLCPCLSQQNTGTWVLTCTVVMGTKCLVNIRAG